MAVDLELAPKVKRAAGVRCCEPVVYPDVERDQATRMAAVAKALGDPVRLQLADVLRKHAGKVCVCELVPLFDLSQPSVSHHLGARTGHLGPVGCGLLLVIPDALSCPHGCRLGPGVGRGSGRSDLGTAVGPTGRALGFDMTDEMLELARANATAAGVENVEFLKGYLEDMRLGDGTVDVVISNCVINLWGTNRRCCERRLASYVPAAGSPSPT